jgi:uncharacterized protein YbgA (DUF1722 family)/uncharacterized protein YbbK (DUF523 family)
MNDCPKLGISACLLGEKVRYDGGHKLNHYLKDVLGQFVTWVPLCPEVECGLPIPREAMHLFGEPESARMVTIKTGLDQTERMLGWADRKLDQLEGSGLCGFVLKSKSPSCGMRDVRIYGPDGKSVRKGSGLFAWKLRQRFPLLPVEDEGRLNDLTVRENFIERVFVCQRWKDFLTAHFSTEGLISFHTDHKLLIMSHSSRQAKELGNMVAQAGRGHLRDTCDHYVRILMATLTLKATIKKNVNVMHHLMGYLKKLLTADEKQELLEFIADYHKNVVPLIVPIVLLNHYVRKFDIPYLKRQYYLNPHPLELMLRNHT